MHRKRVNNDRRLDSLFSVSKVDNRIEYKHDLYLIELSVSYEEGSTGRICFISLIGSLYA